MLHFNYIYGNIYLNIVYAKEFYDFSGLTVMQTRLVLTASDQRAALNHKKLNGDTPCKLFYIDGHEANITSFKKLYLEGCFIFLPVFKRTVYIKPLHALCNNISYMDVS